MAAEAAFFLSSGSAARMLLASTAAAVKAGCMQWAHRHLAEFEADLEQRRVDTANRQHWLGNQ